MVPSRKLALTSELVARVHREVPDSGIPAGFGQLDDEDYKAIVARLLEEADLSKGVWVFAYGSLIWKPAWPVETQHPAQLRGWHRSFCMRLPRFRGTPDRPGLMMSLDRGGSCRGVIQHIPAPLVVQHVDQFVRREFTAKPSTNRPRWVTVECEGERIPAIVIAINRNGPMYAGGHSLEETAAILARACGHWGSGAEYLMNTVAHLESLGIHDRYLWKLQELVAQEIEAMPAVGTQQNAAGE